MSSIPGSAAATSAREVIPASEGFAFDALLGDEPNSVVLRAVLDGAEHGIAACDAAGVLRYLNRVGRQLYGLPEPGSQADRWTEHCELLQPDGVTPLDPSQAPLARALRDGRVEGAEVVIVTPRGTSRRVVARGAAILATVCRLSSGLKA